MYQGQCGEDRQIHQHYFPSFQRGTFLELGACDGVLYSNTKFFEDTLKWNGVLIEPDPSAFQKLQINRPRAQTVNAAISTIPGTVSMFLNGPVGSVQNVTSETRQNNWHKDNNSPLIQVPSRKLSDILHESNVSRIDFWSLDVEGSEAEVLKTMDWNIPVQMILIEEQEPQTKEECETILRSNGFQFVEKCAHNEIWINPSNQPVLRPHNKRTLPNWMR